MNQELITAVEAIKTAILQSQYQAAKETTRVQLILYYGIGRYLSSKKGKKTGGGEQAFLKLSVLNLERSCLVCEVFRLQVLRKCVFFMKTGIS